MNLERSSNMCLGIVCRFMVDDTSNPQFKQFIFINFTIIIVKIWIEKRQARARNEAICLFLVTAQLAKATQAAQATASDVMSISDIISVSVVVSNDAWLSTYCCN